MVTSGEQKYGSRQELVYIVFFFFFTNSLTFKSFFLHNKIILDN